MILVGLPLSDQELALNGHLGVQYLDIFKEALLKTVDQDGVARVDFSQVRKVDIAALQLLLAWLGRAHSNSRPRLVNLPQFMKQALELSGLRSHFAPFME